MRWFQHRTDSHTNLKHREILTDFGLEGYAVYWICLELVGQQGTKYRLNGSKSWRKALKDITNLSQEKIEKLLLRFGELGLICHKSLQKGDLYIPKMREYSDDYTKRIRTLDKQCSLRIDKIRIDKIILHYIKEKGWEESIKKNPSLQGDIFKRNVKPAKQLLMIANNDEEVIKSITRMTEDYKKKNLSWTLETVIRHYAELTKSKSWLDEFKKET